MSKRTGIDTSIDYYQPKNEYTRFILYSYLYREEKLPHHPAKIEIVDKSPMFVSAATHIITTVDYGIRLAIILQLPNISNTIVAIDKVLE
ncbi:unnamed protein product, partial [Rotaria magnacalcarata]